MEKKPSFPSRYLIGSGLGVLWLTVQVGLFFLLGISHMGDSPRYLGAAESLLQGKLPTGKELSFLGYDLFVTFFFWSGLGEIGVVVAQVLLTSVAAYCLYRLACRLYDSRTGLLAAFFYIAYAEIHTWNFYILTDSLFISMLIISLFLVVERGGWWRTAIACLAVIFTSTIRPNGVVLLVSVGVYVLYSLWRAKKYKVFVGVAFGVAVASPIAIDLVGKMLAHASIIHIYASGKIISGYKGIVLKMPGVLPAPPPSIENPLFHILFFIASKPVYFLKLVGMKLWYYFLHARPFYSDFHNYFSVLTLFPTYVLAVGGVLSRTEYPAEKLLLISLCFFQSLVVALRFADWDGRHLLVILPIVFLFAARGAWRVLGAGKALLKLSHE